MEERDETKPDVAERSESQCNTATYVKVIHQSFEKMLQQTTNDDFRRKMISICGAQNSRVFGERFAESLVKLTSVLHHIDVEKSFLVGDQGADEDDDAADLTTSQLLEPNAAAEIELSALSQTTINYLEEWLKFSQGD